MFNNLSVHGQAETLIHDSWSDGFEESPGLVEQLNADVVASGETTILEVDHVGRTPECKIIGLSLISFCQRNDI